jgi:hypothetical protein
MGRLTFSGLIARFAASLLLVLLTFNPTGFCYAAWVAVDFPHVQPVQAIVGLVLLGLWIFFVHATWRSLGAIGVVLGLAFFAAVAWLLSTWGWLTSSSHLALIWLVLVVVACMLTVGLCWGLIRVRVSGQPVIEDVKG